MVRISEPYKLASRTFKPDNTVVTVGDVRIGGDEVIVMAGPCSAESEQQVRTTATAVRRAGAKIFRGGALPVSVSRSFCMALLVYAFINLVFYPAILEYQAGMPAGRWIERFKPDEKVVYMLREGPVNYSMEFYSPAPVRRIPMDSLAEKAADGPVLVFLPAAYSDSLDLRGFRYHYSILQFFPNFHVSQLTGEFLNAKTRGRVTETWLLLKVH